MSCFFPPASPTPPPSPLVLLRVDMVMTLNMSRVPVCLSVSPLLTYMSVTVTVVSLTVRLCKNILLETICHVKNLEDVVPW